MLAGNDLRHGNQFLWKKRFKYKDLQIAMMLFNPCELMFYFDVKLTVHRSSLVPIKGAIRESRGRLQE